MIIMSVSKLCFLVLCSILYMNNVIGSQMSSSLTTDSGISNGTLPDGVLTQPQMTNICPPAKEEEPSDQTKAPAKSKLDVRTVG
jgi:hypothetical protein